MSEKNSQNIANCHDEITLAPATDIYETNEVYALKLEMPGVDKEYLQITIENDELEIRGEVKGELEEGKEIQYSKYPFHNFYRKFRVGSGIDRNRIDATLENGLLSLVLHKAEDVKPKKIEVKVA